MRRKPPPLTPRQRYAANLRLGLSKDDAMAAVVYDIGLVSNIVRLASDGRPKPEPKWTLREVERLVFVKWMAEHGQVGGPNG